MQVSTDLQKLECIFLLYTADWRKWYVSQFEPFLHLCHWFEFVNLVETPIWQAKYDHPMYDKAPDICGKCLTSYGMCIGGRVRSRCIGCYQDTQISAFFTDPWPNRISQLTGLSPEIVEFYTAKALYIHAQVRANKDKEQHPHESAVKPIQPDIQADSRADSGKPRRFNFARSG